LTPQSSFLSGRSQMYCGKSVARLRGKVVSPCRTVKALKPGLAWVPQTALHADDHRIVSRRRLWCLRRQIDITTAMSRLFLANTSTQPTTCVWGGNWGVFALAQEERGDPVMFFQLSINRDGI